jgi:hypothetical protein
MGAGDLIQKTIKDKTWDKGEEVVIREMTYAESSQLTTMAMSDLTAGDVDSEEKIQAVKVASLDMARPLLATLEMCIVSWTLTKNGKVMEVNPENIAGIKGAYGDFIMEEINKLNPEPDAEFQKDSDDSLSDRDRKTTT